MRSFKRREKARRYAMQALYTWLMSKNSIKDVEAYYLADRNPRKYDTDYFLKLLNSVPLNLNDLENQLSPFLEKPINTIDPIELTILRIATYELKYCEEIPYRVIIHESIELAKSFGSIYGYKFINGVLDSMAKKLRQQEVPL